MKLYGIANCDSFRKARKFLTEHNMDFEIHDFRKEGLTPQVIDHWIKHVDYATLINKRSTSWKNLDSHQRQHIEQGDLDLLCQHSTLIKRPVLEGADWVLVGFKLENYQQLLA